MKKIIIFISLCSVITVSAADDNFVGGNYGLFSGSSYKLGPNYSISAGSSHKATSSLSDYSLFSSSKNKLALQGAWVGVAGKYGELKLGSHDSIGNLATVGADQQRRDSAYDLLIQDDEKLSQSLTYIGKSGVISVGAQIATDESEAKKASAGFLLNVESRSVEAAIGYKSTIGETSAVKGRLTYKSRNNSRVRLDLVAEKVDAGTGSTTVPADSTSIMVGATYKVTPKAYVVGQYGVVGFDDIGLSVDNLTENNDYNALSLEAGYSLNNKASVYVNHTQKSFDSDLQMPFSNTADGSQTNSIGVRLNW